MLGMEVLPAAAPGREHERVLGEQLGRALGALGRLLEVGRVHADVVVHVAEQLHAPGQRVEPGVAVEAQLARLVLVVLELGVHDHLLAQLAERDVDGHRCHVVRAELQHLGDVVPVEQIGIHLLAPALSIILVAHGIAVCVTFTMERRGVPATCRRCAHPAHSHGDEQVAYGHGGRRHEQVAHHHVVHVLVHVIHAPRLAGHVGERCRGAHEQHLHRIRHPRLGSVEDSLGDGMVLHAHGVVGPQLPSSPKRPSRTFGRLLAMFSRMSDCT